MNFSDEDIKRQMRLGEDSHWEFKEIEFAGEVPKSPRRIDLTVRRQKSLTMPKL